MNIKECINRVDELRPNAFSEDIKISWLNELETKIKKEIIDTHEGGESITFEGYNKKTPTDTKLIARPPHESVYIYYLFAKISYNHDEPDRYNNDMIMFNSAFSDYWRKYNMENRPINNSGIRV